MEPNIRGCYCGLWMTKPEVLEQQGVPPDYCGLCEICGKPGHTRHFPGPVPYTGSWCDWHYRRIALTYPAAPFGCLLWMAVISSIIMLVRWLAR